MAGTARLPTLEAALDELYGVEPASFVEVRKRFAGALRSAGDPAAAKSLLAQRRPTTAAWALNQLSREHPELVEAFLAASHDLERAQTGELAGGREAARDATRARHATRCDAVSDAALATLGGRGTDAFRASDPGHAARCGGGCRGRRAAPARPVRTGVDRRDRIPGLPGADPGPGSRADVEARPEAGARPAAAEGPTEAEAEAEAGFRPPRAIAPPSGRRTPSGPGPRTSAKRPGRAPGCWRRPRRRRAPRARSRPRPRRPRRPSTSGSTP